MKLKPVTKAEWVAALRSGDYKQARQYLTDIRDDETIRYCCIGVLGSLMGMSDRKLNKLITADVCEITDNLNNFKIGSTYTRDSLAFELIRLNDKYRNNFDQIADWIEANVN